MKLAGLWNVPLTNTHTILHHLLLKLPFWLIALARSPTQLKLDDARIPQHRFDLRFKLCVITKPFCCFARMIWPWLCFVSNCACSPNHFVFFSFLFGNSLNESAPGCNLRCHSITWRIAWMMLRGLLALIDLKLTCHYLHSYFRNFSGFGCRWWYERRHFILLASFGDLSKIDNIHSNIRTSFGKDFGDEIVKFCEGATEKGRARWY